MKKILCKVSVVIILIIVLISAVACSSASDNYNGAPGSAPSIGGDYDKSEGTTNDSVVGDDGPIVTTTDRMMVYYVDIALTVKEGSKAVSEIKEKLVALGGYEQSSYMGNNGYYRCTLRVPTEKLDEFVNSVTEKGKVNNKTVTSEDITEQYTAVLARKNALQAQYTYLETLLNSGTLTVQESLQVREQLYDVAYDLDRYTTQLDNYKKKSDYSTVTISIYKEGEYVEPTFWDELGDTLLDSGNSVGVFFGGLLTALVAVLPYLLIIGAVFGLYVLIKFLVCKKKKIPFTLFKKLRDSIKLKKAHKEAKKLQMQQEIDAINAKQTEIAQEQNQTEVKQEQTEE